VAYAVGNERLRKAQYEKNQTLLTLQAIIEQALRAEDIEMFCDRVWSSIRDQLHIPYAHIGIITGNEIEFPTRAHLPHPPLPLVASHQPAPTIIHEALRTRSVVRNEIQVGEQPLGDNWPEARSAIVLSLPGDDGVPRGVLVLHDNWHPNRFTSQDQLNLATIAAVLGLALHHLIRTTRWKAVAGIFNAPYIIPQAMLTPLTPGLPELANALNQLVHELYVHVFAAARFDFTILWEWRAETGEFHLGAVEPPTLRAELATEIRPRTGMLRKALDVGAVCFQRPTLTTDQDVISGEVPSHMNAVCVAPIRTSTETFGVIMVGMLHQDNLTKDTALALDDIAQQIAWAWQQRLALTTIIRDLERKQMREQTHAHALSAAHHADIGWREFKQKWLDMSGPRPSPELLELADALSALLENVPAAIEIALRGGHYAVSHGLVNAIHDLLMTLRIIYAGERHLEAQIDPNLSDQLSDEEVEALFTIATSAVSNALKAQRVHEVHISLQLDEKQRAVLCVRDDGEGFDPEAIRRDQGHIGVRSMFDLAHKIGWTINVVSESTEGTRIYVSQPATSLLRSTAPV
jgi:signal transduction histidine kinase